MEGLAPLSRKNEPAELEFAAVLITMILGLLIFIWLLAEIFSRVG
jgi:hypothetical protein